MSNEQIPFIVEIEQLPDLPAQGNILPVAVCQSGVFASQHIPGSVLIEPAELMSGIKPAVGSIPSAQQLSEVFSRIGLQANTHVIAYDDEGGGWAGRLIWTLDVIGHQQYSYLNGGLIAWLKSGRAVESGAATVTPTAFKARINSELLRDKHYIIDHLDDEDTLVWDARSPEEYAGTKITALRNGHIPGARNLDWLELMDRENDLRLHSDADLREKLARQGIAADKTIITHCQTHHRSGLSYLVGKHLGLDISAYDGSWADWGNDPETPIETGA